MNFMNFRLFKQTNYEKSNSTTTIKIPISDEARRLTSLLLKSKIEEERQTLGDGLLDELADLAKIDIVNLKISETKQYHKKRNGKVAMKRYGYYKPGNKYIYISNRTAVRGQILAPKTFLDTLLHEWTHHYDYQKLGLNSIHSAGFYARLKDIKEKLGYFVY